MFKCFECIKITRKKNNKSAKKIINSFQGKKIFAEKRKKYRSDPIKREKEIQRCKNWRKNNRDKVNQYSRKYEKDKKIKFYLL